MGQFLPCMHICASTWSKIEQYQEKSTIRTMLIELWMLFVHTLRGQYDDLQGSADVLWQRQVALKNR